MIHTSGLMHVCLQRLKHSFIHTNIIRCLRPQVLINMHTLSVETGVREYMYVDLRLGIYLDKRNHKHTERKIDRRIYLYAAILSYTCSFA